MDPADAVVDSTAEHVEIPVTLTGCATTLHFKTAVWER
jgi:hypothetical protein